MGTPSTRYGSPPLFKSTPSHASTVQPFGFALPSPVMGPEGEAGGGTETGSGGNAPEAGGMQTTQQQSGASDTGFPPNTPVAEMTDAQRAAYFKHQNRQADNKLAAFQGVTTEEVSKRQAKLPEL